MTCPVCNHTPLIEEDCIVRCGNDECAFSVSCSDRPEGDVAMVGIIKQHNTDCAFGD